MINKNAELERAYERGYADGMAAESIARTKKYPIAFTHEEYNAVIEAAIADGAKTEREACAALCFRMWNEWLDSSVGDDFLDTSNCPDAEDCAAAIRARGKG